MNTLPLQLKGRAWVLGDNIDTDLLAPGHAMRKPLPELARHCLEAVVPGFATNVRRGDLVVAGEGFGSGSSREQAVEALMHLGISVVLAKSVARIFYRNALNLGLPVVRFEDAGLIANHDVLAVNLADGTIENVTTSQRYRHEPIPAFLLDLLQDGGLIPHLHKRLHP